MASTIPLIDLGGALAGDPAERKSVARAIDMACCDIGFFTICGHGVPDAIGRDLRAVAHEFFRLPLEEKRRSAPSAPGIPRGYQAQGGEALAYANDKEAPPDLKEFYMIGPLDIGTDPYYTSARGRQFFLPNIWPARPARFRAAVTDYYRSMNGLAIEVLRLIALALGIEERFFDDRMARAIGTMRINYYPAQDAPPLEGQLRSGAHTDYGLLTLLNGEDVPGGLQIRTRAGEWIDVRTPPEHFVVNIADLLMRWTNDRWLSNLHRVVNPPFSAGQNKPRVSVAWFGHPNYDVLVECIAKPGEAKHPPVLSGDYRDMKYGKTGLQPTVAA